MAPTPICNDLTASFEGIVPPSAAYLKASKNEPSIELLVQVQNALKNFESKHSDKSLDAKDFLTLFFLDPEVSRTTTMIPNFFSNT